MNKIEFKDLPSTDTPIDSANLNLLQNNVENDIGDLSNLNTNEKTNLVGAINEVNNKPRTLKIYSKTLSTSERIGSEGGNLTIDVTQYKNVLFVEPLFAIKASDYSGGTMLSISNIASYVYAPGTTFTGIYVSVKRLNENQLQMNISNYEHSGRQLSGYRLYYYGD